MAKKQKSLNMTEYEMTLNVLKKFKNYELFEEVAFFRRSIDLVLIDSKKDILKTIEFKLSDWKKAIKQAIDHQIIADYAYLCMPKKKINAQMMEQLNKYGIGLYLYDSATDNLELVVQPRKSETHRKYFKAKIMTRLQGA